MWGEKILKFTRIFGFFSQTYKILKLVGSDAAVPPTILHVCFLYIHTEIHRFLWQHGRKQERKEKAAGKTGDKTEGRDQGKGQALRSVSRQSSS